MPGLRDLALRITADSNFWRNGFDPIYPKIIAVLNSSWD